MTALNIQTQKISNLHQLNFTENRIICEQSDDLGKSLILFLHRRFKNGQQRIFMVGTSYKHGHLVKATDLGIYKPDERGAKMILAACRCYSFNAMHDVISD